MKKSRTRTKLIIPFTDGRPKDKYVVRQALEQYHNARVEATTISIAAGSNDLCGRGNSGLFLMCQSYLAQSHKRSGRHTQRQPLSGHRSRFDQGQARRFPHMIRSLLRDAVLRQCDDVASVVEEEGIHAQSCS
jgi:hypothetical protein